MERPLIWDVQTGARFDLDMDDLEGEVNPAAWSPDSERILLVQSVRAVQRLHVYDISEARSTPLEHSQGTYTHLCFVLDATIHAVCALDDHLTIHSAG